MELAADGTFREIQQQIKFPSTPYNLGKSLRERQETDDN